METPVTEDKQPTQAELEASAAAFLGEPTPTPEPPADAQAESQPESPEKVEPPTLEPPLTGQASTPVDELREIFKDTPYYVEGRDLKEVAAELKRGYKELQGQFTQQREKVKPHEQLLNLVGSDPKLANFVQEAVRLYQNPQLVSSYVNPQGQVISGEPDITKYDLYAPEGLQKYHQDMIAYSNRMAHELVGSEMSGWKQQQTLELQKLEFKKIFPDVNPDDVIQKAQMLNGRNPLETAWKALNYDNIKTLALEESRRELKKGLEEASAHKTPQGAPPSKPISITDILTDISKKGSAYAKKKYGVEAFEGAMRHTAQFV